MGVIQGAEDLTRIFLNSAMGGLPSLIGPNAQHNAAELAAARERMGLAGDIANVGGYVVPGVGALKAPKAVVAGARMLPAAERAIERAVVPGFAAREAARLRLGLAAQPTMAGVAAKAAGGAVKAYPKTALTAAVLGPAAVAVSHNSRVGAEPAAPGAPVSAAPSMSAEERAAAVAQGVAHAIAGSRVRESAANALSNAGAHFNRVAPPQSAAGPIPGSEAPTFMQLVGAVAAANGGKVSMHDLANLSDVAYKTAPTRTQLKPRTAKDIGMEEYLKAATELSNQELEAAKQQGPEAYQSAAQRALQRLAPFVGADQFGIPQMAPYGEAE